MSNRLSSSQRGALLAGLFLTGLLFAGPRHAWAQG